MMAQQNLLLVADMIALLQSDYPAEWTKLAQKLSFQQQELAVWADIREKIVLPYDAARDLYEEDDMYFCRVPLDLGKMKTSLKRVIDTTLPYEALMLYQITKQADVLHVMKNLHWRFTLAQKRNAWNYYVSKTCFDSSLGYCMHAVMAAQMGLDEDAYQYYAVCSNFDIRNMQLNTISGLHFANFGGTWQAVVFGFAGVQVDASGISIAPCLPKAWESLSFPLCYQGNRLQICVTHKEIIVQLEKGNDSPVNINLAGKLMQLKKTNREIRVLLIDA